MILVPQWRHFNDVDVILKTSHSQVHVKHLMSSTSRHQRHVIHVTSSTSRHQRHVISVTSSTSYDNITSKAPRQHLDWQTWRYFIASTMIDPSLWQRAWHFFGISNIGECDVYSVTSYVTNCLIRRFVSRLGARPLSKVSKVSPLG
jgi:hypothetical protein